MGEISANKFTDVMNEIEAVVNATTPRVSTELAQQNALVETVARSDLIGGVEYARIIASCDETVEYARIIVSCDFQ